MAIAITGQGGRAAAYVTELILDSDADIESLDANDYAPGSTAFVISTSKILMLNTNGEWKEI